MSNDQSTSNLLVYNLQLPYKYNGHHFRDGHNGQGDHHGQDGHHGQDCHHGRDGHHGQDGNHGRDRHHITGQNGIHPSLSDPSYNEQ